MTIMLLSNINPLFLFLHKNSRGPDQFQNFMPNMTNNQNSEQNGNFLFELNLVFQPFTTSPINITKSPMIISKYPIILSSFLVTFPLQGIFHVKNLRF